MVISTVSADFFGNKIDVIIFDILWWSVFYGGSKNYSVPKILKYLGLGNINIHI